MQGIILWYHIKKFYKKCANDCTVAKLYYSRILYTTHNRLLLLEEIQSFQYCYPKLNSKLIQAAIIILCVDAPHFRVYFEIGSFVSTAAFVADQHVCCLLVFDLICYSLNFFLRESSYTCGKNSPQPK